MTGQGCLSKKLSILIFNTDPLFHVFDFNMWQNSWEFFANASQFIECTTSYNVNTYICRYGWTVEMVSKIIRKFQANSTQNLKFAFISIDYRWINIIRSFVLRNFILLENFTMSCMYQQWLIKMARKFKIYMDWNTRIEWFPEILYQRDNSSEKWTKSTLF